MEARISNSFGVESINEYLEQLIDKQKWLIKQKSNPQIRKAKLEISQVIKQVKAMPNICLNNWVINSLDQVGQVVGFELLNSLPVVDFKLQNGGELKKDSPLNLKLVTSEQLKYVWYGASVLKLVRKLDQAECDDLDILGEELAMAQINLETTKENGHGSSYWTLYQQQINYCKARIKALKSKIVPIKNEDELQKLESIIQANLEAFYKVGKALYQIKSQKLYKELGYTSFAQYCKERWAMGKTHAYRLIASVEVMENVNNCSEKVSPIGDKILPTSEYQTRELAKVPKDQQAEVWDKAVDRFGENPTANQIKQITEFPVAKIKFFPNQVLRLKLSSFDGASDELKNLNHHYCQIQSEQQNHYRVFFPESKQTQIVKAEDLKPVTKVDFTLTLDPFEYLELLSIYGSADNIRAAIKSLVNQKGV